MGIRGDYEEPTNPPTPSYTKNTTEVRRNGLMVFRNISCTPLHPQALLYNRIFKTASTTVKFHMEQLQYYLNYTLHFQTTEDWYDTGNDLYTHFHSIL